MDKLSQASLRRSMRNRNFFKLAESYLTGPGNGEVTASRTKRRRDVKPRKAPFFQGHYASVLKSGSKARQVYTDEDG